MRSHTKLTVIMTQTLVPVKDFEHHVKSISHMPERTAATFGVSGVFAVSGVSAVSYLVYLEYLLFCWHFPLPSRGAVMHGFQFIAVNKMVRCINLEVKRKCLAFTGTS